MRIRFLTALLSLIASPIDFHVCSLLRFSLVFRHHLYELSVEWSRECEQCMQDDEQLRYFMMESRGEKTNCTPQKI